jgi:predicted site-specific integrase-resolvase
VGEDRTPSVRRTTVAEAAEVLGISAEAVRGRIRRGTLPVEREGGKVYVLIESPPYNRTTTDQPSDRTDALLAAYRDRVEDLREQLQVERQAHAEARRLLAAALERIPPQLEAPQEPSEAPQTASEEAER